MITDKVILIETIPTQAYGNVRMGIEGTLEPGETLFEAYQQAKKDINDSFNRLYGNVSQPNVQEVAPYTMQTAPPVIDRSIERIEILIDDCKTKAELLDVYFKNATKIQNTDQLRDHYTSRMIELEKTS